MKKPKILFVAHHYSFDTGGEHSFFEVIKGAQKRGYNIHVTTPKAGNFERVLTEAGLEYSVVHYGRWPGTDPEYDDTVQSWQAVDELCQLIAAKDIDVVMTNTSVQPWASLAAARMNVPHIWRVCEFPLGVLSHVANHYDFIGAYSNKIIANSERLATYIQQTFKLPDVSFARSYNDMKTRALGHKDKNPRIISVGYVHPHKNQLEILKAALVLKQEYNQKIPVLIIGGYKPSDPYFLELKQFVTENGLQDQVTFKGFSNNHFAWLGPNDILVQSSVSESLGRVIVEGMQLGLVCVGSDIPGNKEAFALGGGTLYKQGDPSDLAKQLDIILNDLPKYKKTAKVAQAKVQKNLSEEKCHDPMFEVVDVMLGKPNPMVKVSLALPLVDSLLQETRDKNNPKKKPMTLQLRKIIGRR